MLKTKLIMAAVALTTAFTASAGFLDGNTLLAKMQGSETDQLIASGYVAGAYDTLNQVVVCPPQGSNIALKQVMDIVERFIVSVPEARHLGADTLISFTLSKTWPCPKKPAGKDKPNA